MEPPRRLFLKQAAVLGIGTLVAGCGGNSSEDRVKELHDRLVELHLHPWKENSQQEISECLAELNGYYPSSEHLLKLSLSRELLDDPLRVYACLSELANDWVSYRIVPLSKKTQNKVYGLSIDYNEKEFELFFDSASMREETEIIENRVNDLVRQVNDIGTERFDQEQFEKDRFLIMPMAEAISIWEVYTHAEEHKSKPRVTM